MPTRAPMIALLVAFALAALLVAATPWLLRWLPVPPDEPGVPPFAELNEPRFSYWLFGCAVVAGTVSFTLTEPQLWATWAPLATLGALLGLIDLRTGFLPLRLNYLAVGLALVGSGLAAWLTSDWSPVIWSTIGGVGAAAFFWLMWRFSSGRLGFGDVRLAGLIGVVAGATSAALVVWSIVLGSLVGALWGLAARWRRGADGPFPYGPSLLLGPLLALALSWAVRPG